MKKRTTHPKRAKGRRYPTEISCVSWIDLLGFGDMLRGVDFNPSHPTAIAAVDRLTSFHNVGAEAAARNFPVLQLNDGMVFFRQLSPRSRSVTADFLIRSIGVFNSANEIDRDHSYPGARMVVAAGPRMRIEKTYRPRIGHLEVILAKLQAGQISIFQGIQEALRSTPISGKVPMLQANFAFTKAYLADQGGSDAGLVGPNCFIDLDLFGRSRVDWISFTREVDWETQGMETAFGEFSNIDKALAGRVQYHGILNALELADIYGVVL